jgi:hypothetical protein
MFFLCLFYFHPSFIHIFYKFYDPVHKNLLVIPHSKMASVGAIQITTLLHQFALLFHCFRVHCIMFNAYHKSRN